MTILHQSSLQILLAVGLLFSPIYSHPEHRLEARILREVGPQSADGSKYMPPTRQDLPCIKAGPGNNKSYSFYTIQPFDDALRDKMKQNHYTTIGVLQSCEAVGTYNGGLGGDYKHTENWGFKAISETNAKDPITIEVKRCKKDNGRFPSTYGVYLCNDNKKPTCDVRWNHRYWGDDGRGQGSKNKILYNNCGDDRQICPLLSKTVDLNDQVPWKCQALPADAPEPTTTMPSMRRRPGENHYARITNPLPKHTASPAR